MNQATDSTSSELDLLVKAVRHSAKYQRVCEDIIRHVGARELAKGRTWKEALKATKSRLHQVGGAYLDGPVDFTHWTAELHRAAASGRREEMQAACREVLRCQSSTRERLAILDQFYSRALAGLPPIRSVLDIACGLNPLAVFWMPVTQGVEYYAYDIYEDMVEFLNGFLDIAQIRGRAVAQDVTLAPPDRPADLALILKSLPCLEQLDPGAGLRLLDSLPARHLLVSFPKHSLGGRPKGMSVHYEGHFRELIAGRPFSAKRFEFPSELAFLLTRSEPASKASTPLEHQERDED